MKQFFIFCLIFSFLGCTKTKEEDLSYVVQYKSQLVTPEAFLKKLIIQSYIKYKEQRVEKLKDDINLEGLKKETLALAVQEIFVNDLANKHSIVIKDDELKDWINERSVGTKKESLNLFLNSNGLSTEDWNRMFKNQLLMHKIKNFLSDKPEKEKKKKLKRTETYVQIGVLSFEEKHEAENTYIRLRKRQASFKDLLKAKTGSDQFQWLPEKSLPFYEKVKKMRLNRVSRAFQTDWGYSLVIVKKREKKPSLRDLQEVSSDAPSQTSEKWASALKEFKESIDLKINFDLYYGLKLKRD